MPGMWDAAVECADPADQQFRAADVLVAPAPAALVVSAPAVEQKVVAVGECSAPSLAFAGDAWAYSSAACQGSPASQQYVLRSALGLRSARTPVVHAAVRLAVGAAYVA